MQKNTIIYIADPLCSWCYGFSPVIAQLKNDFSDPFAFRQVMGGLRPGGGDAWDDGFRDMLRHHWEQVAQASGQPFNFDLLSWPQFNYDTEPASRAVRVVRDLAPEKEFPFFQDIQVGFYHENRDPVEATFYQPICETHDISYETFLEKFNSEAYRQLTREDFIQSAEWGIRGFPTIVLQMDDELGILSNGYQPYAPLKEKMEAVVKQINR